MQHDHASHHNDWVEDTTIASYLRQTCAVAEADIRKLVHDPVELLTRMVQRALAADFRARYLTVHTPSNWWH